MAQPFIILTGPTAVGKTSLSIKLAKAINGEIISADSMQVYKGMDIGTAKIKPEEMQGVPHYLIDILSPEEEFNVVKFKTLALEAMNKIYAKGKIPILVGGTGFYIQSVLYDIAFTENKESSTESNTYRYILEKRAEEEGGQVLHNELKKVDPKAAEAIHANNIKKVIRALEFFHETGTKISQHNETERQKTSPYNFIYFVLNQSRHILYERINLRIDQMLEEGLLEEVRNLKAHNYNRELVSMQGLGYKEILSYLEGEISLEEAIYILKRDTRHFAKRQLTWFRREKEVTWIEKGIYPYEDLILSHMLDLLVDKKIIE